MTIINSVSLLKFTVAEKVRHICICFLVTSYFVFCYFLLKYNWFTMSYPFLVYISEVIQLYRYTYSLTLWLITGYWIQFLVLYVFVCVCMLLLFSCPVVSHWDHTRQASLSLTICQVCPSSCPLDWWYAAAAQSQFCLTLCDHIDGSPPGSSVPGILQARTPEWVAISFSNACMHAKSPQSCPILCDLMDSSPPGHSLSRQEYWRGLPCPSPIGDIYHIFEG